MPTAANDFTPQQRARLTEIWDRLYVLYLKRANGDANGEEIDGEIEALIGERNAIRPWGWSTGKDWKDDMPAEELERIMTEASNSSKG